MHGGRRLVAGGWRSAAAAAACAVAAWALTAVAATAWGESALASWRSAAETIAPEHDLWVRLLRGGLGRLTIPFLLAVAAGSLLALVLAGRWRRAAVAAAVLVGANVTVQAIKYGVVPFVPGVVEPQLSGHMAVVFGTALALVLAVPARWRRRAAVAGVVAVLATGAGVMVTGWHTPAEMLAPTLLAAAWAFAALPFARDADASTVPAGASAAGVGAPS